MDYYLSIAEKVLTDALMPLNAREIMRRAHLAQIVPPHLYGKTQHKTLHARISEDIRIRGNASTFYRTERGVFFLNRLRDLPSLTAKQQKGISARPRFRELYRKPILALLQSAAERLAEGNDYIHADLHGEVFASDATAYRKLDIVTQKGDYKIWAFMVVKKDDQILSYRHGSFRENRDGFLHQRTIGFSTLLTAQDATFFEPEDKGLITAGLRSVYADLGVPLKTINFDAERRSSSLEFFSRFSEGERELVCVVTYSCPDWLEPFKRTLAINDLSWLSAKHMPNNLEDFDRWSQKIIPRLFERYRSKTVAAE